MLITRSVHITHQRITCYKQTVFETSDVSIFTEFIKAAFKSLNTPYPKFYKMDTLSKLAFVASEFLLHDQDIAQRYAPESIGLVFQNAASSIDIDKDHQLTIQERANYFPSPALFVYTLPNIMMGEICIRNKFFGENALFITEKFDAQLLYNHVTVMLAKHKMDTCIAGWANVEQEQYESFLLLIEPETMVSNSKEFRTFDAANILKLYTI